MKTLLAFIAVAGIAGFAVTASADQKLYSGSECVAYGTNQSNLSHEAGNAYNASSGWQNVYCPVVIDVYALNASSNWIYLWDRHYSSDISCTLRSQSAVSSSFYYSSVRTVGSTAAPTKHSFSATSYYNEGKRYVYCSIPGVYSGNRSGITGYSVNEG